MFSSQQGEVRGINSTPVSSHSTRERSCHPRTRDPGARLSIQIRFLAVTLPSNHLCPLVGRSANHPIQDRILDPFVFRSQNPELWSPLDLTRRPSFPLCFFWIVFFLFFMLFSLFRLISFSESDGSTSSSIPSLYAILRRNSNPRFHAYRVWRPDSYLVIYQIRRVQKATRSGSKFFPALKVFARQDRRNRGFHAFWGLYLKNGSCKYATYTYFSDVE